MGFWATVPRYIPALDREQSAPLTGARRRSLRLPVWKCRRPADWPRWLKILIPCVLLLAVTFELKTSWLQARLLSAVARRATYSLKPGPDPSILYPAPAPYTDRLGYSLLPVLLPRLQAAGYSVAYQTHASPSSKLLMRLGLFPIYREKPQAGLHILDGRGQELFASPYPGRTYASFEEIPPVAVRSLLFIENREALDPGSPYQNPAVEWARLGRAFLDLGINTVNPSHRVSGGSTLATQIEKIRYSPGGRTSSAGEKLRQVVSASLRAYRDGEVTIEARRRIVRDYFNSLPLAAIPGHGEVEGLGDGLWAWFGADLHNVNRLLSDQALASGVPSEAQALAYRRVLGLSLAVQNPVIYLLKNPASLNARTDAYLNLLAGSGLIPEGLRRRALRVRTGLRDQAPPLPAVSFTDRKGADAIRTDLLSLLGLDSTYTLGRLDLTVRTTLDSSAQEAVTETLRSFQDPAFAARKGMIGDRLLSPGGEGSVVYSFTLYERGTGANLLRVYADSYDQPLSVNEGTKLELGSTAKLRVLAHYLEIIRGLHDQLANLPPAELDAARSRAADPLTRWAADYLSSGLDKGLPAMLEAAVERRYSASPGEGFFTGGGLHYFSNFDPEDNGRILTISEAFRRSVNLVFVRLMRDIVSYQMDRVPGASLAVLKDLDDPNRPRYLARFADMEGSEFLRRFYLRHRDADPVAALAALDGRGRRVRAHPLERWLLEYLVRHPGAGLAEAIGASAPERQAAYDWLFNTKRRAEAQSKRIRIVLERDAFVEIHRAWKKLGFPFDSLTPSFAAALGSSGDNPAALAELAGIILNDGVRYPSVRIRELHFAAGSPVDTILEPKGSPAERVLSPDVAAILRRELFQTVETGTARRAYRSVILSDGTVLPVGGKTGTGDNRVVAVGRGGQRIGSSVRNRTATFVFILGDRFFGTITAYVPGEAAGNYEFTSSLPVQAFKTLIQSCRPLIEGAVGASPADGLKAGGVAGPAPEPDPVPATNHG